MPAGVVGKGEEGLWEEARGLVEHRTKKKLKKDKLSKDDIPWALVNHIFQSKKKKKLKKASSDLVNMAVMAYLKKASEGDNFTCEVSFKGNDSYKSFETLIKIFSAGKEGVLVFDLDSYSGITEAIPISRIGVTIEKDEAADGVITFVLSSPNNHLLKNATFRLASSLRLLGQHGNGGHSYEVYFFPTHPAAKREVFGWDGDGSDRIDLDSITVNGKKFNEEDANKIEPKSGKVDAKPAA
jgi:hypothetical protein